MPATPFQVTPERFIAGGETLARDDEGRVVFVRGGLPGEVVDVELTEVKGDWSRGVAATIHTPSALRVEPPCPHRLAGCGGCDWQHLAPAAQLDAKAEIVRDALRRTGRLADADLVVGASVPFEGYRTTVRVVGDLDGRAAYRIEQAHDTVVADGCLVAHPLLRPLIAGMVVTPGLEVTLRASVATREVTARWDDRGGEVGGLPHDVHTGPSARLRERVAGVELRVSAASFFQSGPAAAELLVDAVRRAAPELDDARVVFDAYAGIGLFAAAAVRADVPVITVETSKSAVSDCRANLADRPAVVEHGEFGRWRPRDDRAVDVVIADPSRSGLGKPGVGTIVAVGAPLLVLVSCDPVALARDTSLLARHGYRHVSSEVLDLFPHTHHVETVTRFTRQNGV